jgi:choline dehydrogenase-like flavoprotein
VRDNGCWVVGAGTAGCVVANPLVGQSRNRVLLLEAGPDYPPGLEPEDGSAKSSGVVDASVMPDIPRANTNLPTLRLAEKLAAGILSRPS